MSMTYLTKNLAYFSDLDGMQAICAEKMSVELQIKYFFTNDRRLQRLYPVEQILCGFHGVLTAKCHPHAAGQHVRQGGGLCLE